MQVIATIPAVDPMNGIVFFGEDYAFAEQPLFVFSWCSQCHLIDATCFQPSR